MPFNTTRGFAGSENILDSEVGLVTKTRQATPDMATQVGAHKLLRSGALFTNPDDETDIGVVFGDYDLTDYEKFPISVVVEGRQKTDKVSAEAKAKKADFAGRGLYLV